MRKTFKILRQAPALRTPVKPHSQSLRTVGRQFAISGFLREIDDCLGAETAVKMIVEKYFRQGTDETVGHAHGRYASLGAKKYKVMG
jgi:hypothetical protein